MAPFQSFLVQRRLPLLSLLLLRRQRVRRTITAFLTRAIFPEGKAQVPLDLLIAEHRVTNAGRNISSPRSAYLVEHAAAVAVSTSHRVPRVVVEGHIWQAVNQMVYRDGPLHNYSGENETPVHRLS